MAFAGLNYLAILVAAVAAFAWGAAYYMALSKQWLAAVGIAEPKMSPVPFVVSFICLLVMGWVLAGVIGHLGAGQATLKNGVISGFFIWLGFVLTTVIVNNVYPRRKWMLSVSDTGHWLGVLLIQGAVIGAIGV